MKGNCPTRQDFASSAVRLHRRPRSQPADKMGFRRVCGHAGKIATSPAATAGCRNLLQCLVTSCLPVVSWTPYFFERERSADKTFHIFFDSGMKLNGLFDGA